MVENIPETNPKPKNHDKINLEEIGVKKKRRRSAPAFWDNDQQRKKAHKYCQEHGLKYNVKEVQLAVREMYRSKNKLGLIPGSEPQKNYVMDTKALGIHGNMAINQTIHTIIDPCVQSTSNRATTSRAAKEERRAACSTNISNKNYKKKNDDKPVPTDRMWKGEAWDSNQKTWILPPNPRTDYFAWYMTFLFPMRQHAIKLGACHERWAEELDSDDRCMMFKPRDHYKTTIITIGYSVFQLCEHQQEYWPILIISKADMNTRDCYNAIKDHLTNNPYILSFYGYLINDDLPNTDEGVFFKFQDLGTNEPGLFCSTFGAKKVMGNHPRLAILDDIQERLLTQAMMYQAKVLLDKSLLGGLPKHAKLLLVGTLKGWDHTNDIYLYADKKGIFSAYKEGASYLVDRITRQPILDSNGEIQYGLVDMKYIKWAKIKAPVLDDAGIQKKQWGGRLRWKWQIKIDILDQMDLDWEPIYPERYTIKDIVMKRLEMREVDKESDDTFWSEFYLKPCKPGGNFFDTSRFRAFPPPGFLDNMDFLKWVHTFHIPAVCMIDPGGKGKKAHGIAMLCVYFHLVQGIMKNYIIDAYVCHKGISVLVEKLATWIVKYNIQVVGCESNFEQNETFAEPIQNELETYCKSNKCMAAFKPITPYQTRGDKVLRLKTQISLILGPSDKESTTFLNQASEDYHQVIMESESYPIQPTDNEWDLLDCLALAKINMADLAELCDEIDCYS